MGGGEWWYHAYLVVDNYPVGLVRVVLGNLIAREYRGGGHVDFRMLLM